MFSCFQTVGRIISGRGCAGRIGVEAAALGIKRAGLVTEKGVVAAGVHEALIHSLEKAGVDCVLYDEAELEPGIGSIEKSSVWANENGVDALLGLGGGSALDTAKATAVLAVHPGPLSQYFGMQKVPGPCLPLILVPTTAGTGSEMTSVAVISDPASETKQGIASDYLYARIAVLDPELTVSLPPFPTAITGMDALVHGIESYVSLNSTFITDALNRQAIRMIIGNIRKAYANGGNVEARTGMLYGAAASGIAFSNTQNGVIHAIGMSFPPGYHIPHGLMMAVCAPVGIAFNLISSPEKFAFIADCLGSAPRYAGMEEKARSVVSGLERLMEDLDIPRGLGKLGIRRDELGLVAKKAAAYRRLMDGNPRKASAEQLERLLEHFY